VLNGSKMWITNGPVADTLVVYAKTDRTAGARGITAFLIEKDFKALPRRRSSTSSACAFRHQRTGVHDCEVPAENVLGAVGNGVNVLMSGLDYERVVLAGGPLASCRPAWTWWCPMCTTPAVRSGDRALPAGAGQARRHVCDHERRQILCLCGRQGCDEGRTTREDAAGAILFAAEKATWMALEAIQCLGGNGYINDFPAGRLLRDAKLYEIGAGTSEIRRMLIGREISRRRDRFVDWSPSAHGKSEVAMPMTRRGLLSGMAASAGRGRLRNAGGVEFLKPPPPWRRAGIARDSGQGKTVAILGAACPACARPTNWTGRLQLHRTGAEPARRRPQPHFAARRPFPGDRAGRAGMRLRRRLYLNAGPAASRIIMFMSSTIAGASTSRWSPTSSPAAPI